MSHMAREAITDFSSQHQNLLTVDFNAPPLTKHFSIFVLPPFFSPNNENKGLIKVYLQISSIAQCSSTLKAWLCPSNRTQKFNWIQCCWSIFYNKRSQITKATNENALIIVAIRLATQYSKVCRMLIEILCFLWIWLWRNTLKINIL